MDRKIEKKKWTLKKVAGLVALAAFVLATVYVFAFSGNMSRLNVQAERLTISTVTEGEFQEFIPVIGTVEPIRTIYLDLVEGGRVQRRIAEEGTMVAEGDPILQLENRNLQLSLLNSEAQLTEQINNLRNTRLLMDQNSLNLRQQLTEINYNIQRLRRQHERNQEMRAKNLISEQDFEEVKDEYEYYLKRREFTLQSHRQDSLRAAAQLEQMEASVNRLQSNFALLQQSMDDLVVKAPVAGQLSSLSAEIGEIKNAGERLGQIDILDGFKVSVPIDEHYLSRVQIGQTGEADIAGRTYRLVIRKVYPEVQDGRFVVDMEFIGGAPEGIRRGQTIRTRLWLGDPAVVVQVAQGGFFQSTGGNWAYVVDPSGEFATRRSIKLGRQNTRVFEVLEGLRPGEKVVTSSYDTFGNADRLMLQ